MSFLNSLPHCSQVPVNDAKLFNIFALLMLLLLFNRFIVPTCNAAFHCYPEHHLLLHGWSPFVT
jgi:hypothetical protein